jgi:hypothetical protein
MTGQRATVAGARCVLLALLALGLSGCVVFPSDSVEASSVPTQQAVPPSMTVPPARVVSERAAFWAVIDSVQDVPDLDDRVEAVQAAVERLNLPQLEAYQRGYVDAHRQLYTWKHWGAATAYLGFVSDDVFFDLRGWVMLHGSAAYLRFEKDPDTLGSLSLTLAADDGEVSSGEVLDYVTHERFKALGGEDISESDELNVYSALGDPTGEELPEDVPVSELFPKNYAAGYGQPWYLDPGALGVG